MRDRVPTASIEVHGDEKSRPRAPHSTARSATAGRGGRAQALTQPCGPRRDTASIAACSRRAPRAAPHLTPAAALATIGISAVDHLVR